MGKRGGSRHLKRMAMPGNLPIKGRKSIMWMLSPNPGPHKKSESLAIGAVLRDMLGVARTLKEAKKILSDGNVLVDGKVVKDERFPIALMDLIELPKLGKKYRAVVKNRKLALSEVKDTKEKLCRVVGKRTIKGGKIAVTMHDGRNLIADNNVKVGATLRMSVPDFKLKGMIPLQPGTRCLVTHGKHAGEVATLQKIIERTGSMESEAEVKSDSGVFVTLSRYLFAVDNEFTV